MSRYRIRIINSEFESCDEAEYPSVDKARQSAIVGATRIAGEAIGKGALSSAVELRIYDGEELAARHVVTVSVADLIVQQGHRRPT